MFVIMGLQLLYYFLAEQHIFRLLYTHIISFCPQTPTKLTAMISDKKLLAQLCLSNARSTPVCLAHPQKIAAIFFPFLLPVPC